LRFAYPPYDFLILIIGTLLTGLSAKRFIFRQPYSSKGPDKLFPYAVVYIPISLLFAFIVDDLPFKFYGNTEFVYDSKGGNDLGPQSVNKEGIVNAGTYLLSVAFNLLLWLFCIVIIIRHFLKKRKPNKETASILDN
jgi:hypothetical protein